MDIFSAVILGIVQGFTEFLPISSTGHLILAREVLGLQIAHGLSVDAILHLATALAVLIYFRTDFMVLGKTAWRWLLGHTPDKKEKNLIIALVLGTVPAVIFGFLLEDILETTFRSPLLVAGALIAGSAFFLLAEHVSSKRNMQGSLKVTVTPREGFMVGLFQALALIPGMSRSGMTIAGGLLLGISREEAARFGFLLSLPIILGAGGKSAYELGLNGVIVDFGTALLAGAIAAFGTGIIAIHYLLKYLRTHTLMVFVVYRVALAVIVLAFIF